MVVLRDHLNGESAEWVDDNEVDDDVVQQQLPSTITSTTMPVIGNVQQWASSPWEDE